MKKQVKKTKVKEYLILTLLLFVGYNVASLIIIPLIQIGAEGNPFNLFGSYRFIILYWFQFLVVVVFSHTIYSLVRKQKESKLKLFDLLPLNVIVYDFLGNITYANKQVFKNSKYKEEDFIGRKLIEFTPEEEREDITKRLKSFIQNKDKQGVLVNTNTTISSTGERIELFIYTMFYDAFHLISFGIDKTELNKTKQMYDDQVKLLWQLFENIPKPMMHLKKDYTISFVNHLLEEFSGLKKEQLIGMDGAKFFKAKNVEKNKKIVQRSMRERKHLRAEEIAALPGGIKYLNFDIVPDKINEDPEGVFIFIHDKTPDLIKEKLLKKEILLNKTLLKISDNILSADSKHAEASIRQSLECINTLFKSGRCYIISKSEDNFYIAYDSVKGFNRSYEGKIIEFSDEAKYYYNNFMENKENIGYEEVTDEETDKFKHLEMFKPTSSFEVSIPDGEKSYVLGISYDEKHQKLKQNEIDFLFSAGAIIEGAIDKMEYTENLKLSEETLNTLIDNTDIGIIITSFKNDVFYCNDRVRELFGCNNSRYKKFVVENIASDLENKTLVHEMLKQREASGRAGCTIKAKTIDDRIIYIKIYSALIDYEANKAYLTTITDVTQYIKD